ncbi:helix-turn-helix domain-containing protein [Roseomonas sp. HF4]|uniref:helix-turn-helix domain-containing protein n=1 Tax=Roseomonas sp. HF4 TaxID=2562313 RepID=UPI001484C84E|nr:helix-turn-helix domain-containing protein [Roseomonas sp. HF4]
MLIRQHDPELLRELRSSPPLSSGVAKRLRRGEVLRTQDRGTEQALQVEQGCLRVCHPHSDGRRQITEFLFAGDRIGLAEVRSHNGSIEAVTPAAITLQPTDPRDEEQATDFYNARLGVLQAKLFMLGHKNAREKLAAFIIEMSDRIAAGGNEVVLPMSRYDIADYLCLSPETVCRNFTQMVADGLVALPESHAVQILHRASLEFIGR